MDTGESAHNAVKTIAQGRPDCFGVPVVTNSYAFFVAYEAAGAQNTRSSLRPLSSEGKVVAKLGRKTRRENEDTRFGQRKLQNSVSSPAKAGDPVFQRHLG